MNIGNCLSAAKSLHSTIFPRECVEDLIEMIKKGGLKALKDDPAAAAACLFSVMAWAISQLSNHDTDPDHPDDGVLTSTDPTLSLLNDLVSTMLTCDDCECPVIAAAPTSGWLMQQVLNLALSYLIAMLQDSDKVEDILEELMKWIKENI